MEEIKQRQRQKKTKAKGGIKIVYEDLYLLIFNSIERSCLHLQLQVLKIFPEKNPTKTNKKSLIPQV